jgi:hypothetical protein
MANHHSAGSCAPGRLRREKLAEALALSPRAASDLGFDGGREIGA